MSWFHQLSDGNSARPPKSSLRRTVPGDPAPGVGAGAGAGVGEGAGVGDPVPPGTDDGPAEGSPPHPAKNNAATTTVTALKVIRRQGRKKRTARICFVIPRFPLRMRPL